MRPIARQLKLEDSITENLPSLMSDFRPSAMPAFEMFAKTGVLWQRFYDSGNADWNIHTNRNELIPVEYCNAILAEIEAANVPAPKSFAARLAKLLTGAYRASEMADPRIFASIVAATFGSYPAEIGLAAVDDLTSTSKWLPSRSEIIDACEKRMGERHYATRVVRKHLEEHVENERRAAEDKEKKEHEARRAERRARYAAEPWLKVIDDHEFTFQVSAKLRTATAQWHSLVEDLVKRFGTEAVDQAHRALRRATMGLDRSNIDWTAARESLERRTADAAELLNAEHQAAVEAEGEKRLAREREAELLQRYIEEAGAYNPRGFAEWNGRRRQDAKER